VAGGKAIDPMHQFQIEPIVPLNISGYDLSLTNSGLWMLIVLVVLWVFMLGGLKGSLIPGRWQMAVESAHDMVAGIMRTSVGPEGKKFVPFIFSIFMFILVANLLGMLPIGIIPGLHTFTVTSHLTVTAVLAFLSFGIVLIVGFARHGLHFFALFFPPGVPLVMKPFIGFIEFFSFLVRPFSLGLRLFAAMTAGHILLKVFAGFIIMAAGAGPVIGTGVGIVSFVLMVGITGLELLICVIQAYVFALLTSLYLNDAVNLH
jgi:F-type H+-transporting ATPase subunit a